MEKNKWKSVIFQGIGRNIAGFIGSKDTKEKMRFAYGISDICAKALNKKEDEYTELELGILYLFLDFDHYRWDEMPQSVKLTELRRILKLIKTMKLDN
jgi:hypothetical protein